MLRTCSRLVKQLGTSSVSQSGNFVVRAEDVPRALQKLRERNVWHARKKTYVQCTPNMLLARATARVKRAYFGNKKIIPRAFHEISSPL